jgi:hypothetical protein
MRQRGKFVRQMPQPPFYDGRSWQICDWTLLHGGKELGWPGWALLCTAKEAETKDAFPDDFPN